MSQGLITHTTLEDIADAIRAQLGTAATFTPSKMASAIRLIGFEMPTVHSWAGASDSDIGLIIDAAHAGIIDLQTDAGWSLGDTRTISIGSFTGANNVSHPAQSIDIVISSFDDYNDCGCIMQFDFLESLSTEVRWSSYDGTTWANCETKNTTMPALVNAMPEWIQNRLITFSCKGGKPDYSGDLVTAYNNKLALRAAEEIIGRKPDYGTPGEGTLISYYATAANRIKKRGINGSADAYWTRSPQQSSYRNKSFIINDSGGTSNRSSSSTAALAPFGCL